MNFLLNRRGLGKVSCSLIASHSTKGLKVIRNDGRIPAADYVFKWGTTTTVREAGTVVNSSEAIHEASNKTGFRRKLGELAPKTWFVAAEVRFPAIVRPAAHSQGRNLYVVRNPEELLRAVEACGAGWYASELIDKTAEYRIYAAQGRAIGVGRKMPRDEQTIAWNMAQGGTCKNVRWDEWPLRVVKASLEAFKLTGLDFGAVDVIVDREEKPYILEVNSAPTLANHRAQTFAKTFDYIVEHGKEPLPLVDRRGGYKKFIHPAVCGEAWIA